MTQQPYAPQYPQAPQQGYPAPPIPYQQQPVQQPYAQPGYPQPYQAPQPPQPQVPLAQGSLSDYYAQPTSGGGPSISWSVNGMQKPIGTTYAGIVGRDVVDGDVQHDTDPKSGQPKFYRDGRPRFVMKVPLKLQPSQEFPEGEAQWFVRGQARDELTRAMNAAGLVGQVSPKEGDAVSVQLIERRPSRGGGNPANIVQVSYQPGPKWAGQAASAGQPVQQQQQGTGAPSPAPVPAAQPQPQSFAQQQVAAYSQQPSQGAPVQHDIQQGPPPQWAQPGQPVQAPQQQSLPAPASLDPAQQQLLAQLEAQRNGQPAQQG